jgi:hypothetical protein
VLSWPSDLDPAAGDMAQSGQGFNQLSLSIALHPGNAQDLAPRTSKTYPFNGGMPSFICDVDVLNLEHDLFGLCLRLYHLQQHGPADHHLGQAGFGCLFGHDGSNYPAPRKTVIRSAMASTSFNLWLMKMTDVPCFWSGCEW